MPYVCDQLRFGSSGWSGYWGRSRSAGPSAAPSWQRLLVIGRRSAPPPLGPAPCALALQSPLKMCRAGGGGASAHRRPGSFPEQREQASQRFFPVLALRAMPGGFDDYNPIGRHPFTRQNAKSTPCVLRKPCGRGGVEA